MWGSNHGRSKGAVVAMVTVTVALGGGLGCPSSSKPDPGRSGSDKPGRAADGAVTAAGDGAAAVAVAVAAAAGDAAVPASVAASATASAAVPGGGVPRKRAMWATWPMPNAPATGLPNAASYDISPKGVVSDLVTGLMWQRTTDPKSYSWIQALQVCERLDLAGARDWRLPSRIELASIVDPTHSQPSIDQHAFPHTPSDWFWTSSVDPVNPTGAAWYVYFYFGYPKTDPTNNVFRVRCVRTAETRRPAKPGATGAKPPTRSEGAWSEPDYDVQKDTVADRGTGLTWQRAVQPRTVSFAEARQYCATLRVGPKGGWRVPTLGELLTLVDERATNPTIDTKAFPKTPSASFWTSSPFADTPSMAWHVYFEYGNALYGLLKGPYHVRCVR